VWGFPNSVAQGVSHFETLFKEPEQVNMGHILNIIGLFPILIKEEENQSLFREVTKPELQAIISYFKRDKCLGPDGWNAEFFEEFFDLLGDDFLKVVEEIFQSWKMPWCINANFIVPISKHDFSNSFDDFRLISMCNCLYNIMAKLIVVRFKPILSSIVTPK